MSALKNQMSWLLRGGANTQAALADYGHGLRALQEKVARVDEELQAERAAGAAKAAQVDDLRAEIAALRDQLRVAVDDLGDRIGHVVDDG
jgi:predicted  nucleic acid-binding Zn-ribbon protein